MQNNEVLTIKMSFGWKSSLLDVLKFYSFWHVKIMNAEIYTQ